MPSDSLHVLEEARERCGLSFFLFFFLWTGHTACGILVPQLRIEPTPAALEAQSLTRWTAREIPIGFIF